MYHFEMIKNMDIDALEDFLNKGKCGHCIGKHNWETCKNLIACGETTYYTRQWLMQSATADELNEYNISSNILEEFSKLKAQNVSLKRSVIQYKRYKSRGNNEKRKINKV